MTHWEMYLFTRLDIFLAVELVLALILSAIGVINYLMSIEYGYDIEDKKAYRKTSKKLLIISIALFILSILTPTQKQAAAIYLIPKIANNERLNRGANMAMDVIELKLKEWLESMTEKEDK